MGLFGFGRKKEKSAPAVEMNEAIYREIEKQVAGYMVTAKMTERPEFHGPESGKDLFEKLYNAYMTNKEVQVLKMVSPHVYYTKCGSLCLGAGACVAMQAAELGIQPAECDADNLATLLETLQNQDAFQLAMQKLDIKPGSKNSQVLDRIVTLGMFTVQMGNGQDLGKPENLKTYLKAMYDAGISMVTG